MAKKKTAIKSPHPAPLEPPVAEAADLASPVDTPDTKSSSKKKVVKKTAKKGAAKKVAAKKVAGKKKTEQKQSPTKKAKQTVSKRSKKQTGTAADSATVSDTLPVAIEATAPAPPSKRPPKGKKKPASAVRLKIADMAATAPVDAEALPEVSQVAPSNGEITPATSSESNDVPAAVPVMHSIQSNGDEMHDLQGRNAAEKNHAETNHADNRVSLEDRIRLHAYFLWEEAGRPEGDGSQFWAAAVHDFEGAT